MAKPNLDSLRQEIDEIDSALHDLLMRRSEVTAEVGRAKRDAGTTGQFLRPGREALVLRRLVERHQGGFPKPVLVRLWREIFAAATAQQGPFSVCVLSGKGATGLRDLARTHFGTLTPIGEGGSPQRVINAVVEGEAQVGVLPMPEDGDAGWWRHLLAQGTQPPRIIARLPFAAAPRGSEGAGSDSRALAMPIDWYLTPHGWRDRNQVYRRCAIDLLAESAEQALDRARLTPAEIDALVVVSSTGVATPSLDAVLMDRLPFRPDVLRLPIFGLGCAGGVSGLARAAMVARAMPGSTVLLLVVELCSLAFRLDDTTKAGIVATALFADGAAAAVIRADETAEGPNLIAWGEHCWPATLDIMGWRIEDDGLGVIFARSIPDLVRERFADALDGFLAGRSLDRSALDGYVCHPGGAKVLAALEDELPVDPPGLVAERAVLAANGNMSAVTVLFVLAERLAGGIGGLHALTSLGPGFTAAFALAEF